MRSSGSSWRAGSPPGIWTTCATRVAYVLNQHPTCRNSDVELAIRYWQIFHPDEIGYESITFDALRA